MSAKITIGTSPSWRPGAILREMEIIQTGGSGTKGIFSYHYTDEELNENIEENLVFWVGLTPTNYEYGRSAFNSADNWVSLSNVNVGFFLSTWSGTKNVTLDEFGTTTTITWNGSLSDSWTSIENWTPNVGPSVTMNVIIPDASTTLSSPTLPAFTEIKTITIEAAGILNAVADAQFTVNGAGSTWSCVGGTFIPNTSNVIFTNADATISGETNFYNVTINTDNALSMVDRSTMRIAGAVTNSGAWNAFVGGQTTVEYNGAVQTVVIPNSATNRYSTLILSGTGIKTLPNSALEILGDFEISGTAETAIINDFIVDNNLTIGSTAKLSVSPLGNLTVTGTLTNDAEAAGFILKSDETGTGSLIQNTPNVKATVERYITADSWHYMFAPMNEILTTTFTTEGPYSNPNIYSYNETTDDYWNISTIFGNSGWASELLSTYLPANKGFIFNRYQSTDKTFSQIGGNLFVESKEFAVSYTKNIGTIENGVTQAWTTFDGWNLIGNPFTAAIDWDLVAKDDIESGTYFYDGDNYQYYVSGGGSSAWNVGITLNGGSNMVPSGQAFFVKVINTDVTHSGMVTISPASRMHSEQAFWKKTIAEVPNILKLKLSTGNLSDETVIRTIPDASQEHDAHYDAYKKFSWNPTHPQIYTYNIDNSNLFAVNALPEMNEEESLPLGVYAGISGTYTIRNIENTFVERHIYLEDNQLNTLQNITVKPEYTFTQGVENNENRFFLLFAINHSPTAFDIPNQNTEVEKLFLFTLPDKMFTDPDYGDILNYTATLSNGDPLPDWLNFEAGKKQFSGIPKTIQSLDISVTAHDFFGKAALSSFNIEVEENALSVENANQYAVSVYPNPSSGILKIKFTGFSEAQISVSDIAGRIVFRKYRFLTLQTIDLSPFGKGIYFVEIRSEHEIFRSKIEIR